MVMVLLLRLVGLIANVKLNFFSILFFESRSLLQYFLRLFPSVFVFNKVSEGY